MTHRPVLIDTHPLQPARRRFLGLAAATLVAGLQGRLAVSAAAGDRKLVLVILRGGLDGLAAVAPWSEDHYRAARGRLALAAPGDADGVLPLADGFGLHPRLAQCHGAWTKGELAVLHAVASPYRDRSHFDAQDVLESGGARVYGAADGWLNRALAALPPPGAEGVAIANTVPLVLRGPARVTSWAPSIAPAPESDTQDRLRDLYAGDALLGPTLERALDTAAIAGAGMGGTAAPERRGARFGPAVFADLAAAAARLLAAPQGPRAAVLSFDGWDTHANQGVAQGALALRLAGLDAALATLRDGLASRWRDTVVVVATEFGRTVAGNGTGGTDHGTGGVAFVLGGAVRGGRMIGDWPGLASGALHEGRDLAPANDLRALFASVVGEHWGLSARDLEGRVFDGLRDPLRFRGLVKA